LIWLAPAFGADVGSGLTTGPHDVLQRCSIEDAVAVLGGLDEAEKPKMR
jgi:hypothetical protein